MISEKGQSSPSVTHLIGPIRPGQTYQILSGVQSVWRVYWEHYACLSCSLISELLSELKAEEERLLNDSCLVVSDKAYNCQRLSLAIEQYGYLID